MYTCNSLLAVEHSLINCLDFDVIRGVTAAGSPTAVQAWQPCPLWEPSPSHPIVLV